MKPPLRTAESVTTRHARLLVLHRVLDSGHITQKHMAELAEQFGVNMRTVEADVAAVKAARTHIEANDWQDIG